MYINGMGEGRQKRQKQPIHDKTSHYFFLYKQREKREKSSYENLYEFP